ncbi:purine catabolism regulator [Clostridium algifaecis]|uniref:Purine catabolism regulator n=1 Tax=Clostridium algifaecis TaxID=1472040 RepID=A0ABS4KVA2_9CLOT|nr:PucR family transcriptional regulator [Clostridium algifaecis]MBP2033972.1 purine catabolism regulator [Clostridium algifaecis]
MRIILDKALKLHPLNKSKLIAGANGLTRPIDQFGVLEAPDSFKFVKNNEFLLTTGFMCKNNHELQYKIVKQLFNRGVCALGIKVNRYITELSPKVIDFCNRNDFPILYVPSEYGWYELFYPLLYLMYIHPGSNEDLLNKMTELSDRILNSNNFDEIVKYIYNIFNIPCYIHINYNNISAAYPVSFQTSDISEFVEHFNDTQTSFITNNIKRIDFKKDSILFSYIKHKMNCHGYILLYEKNTKLKPNDISLFNYIVVCIQFYSNKFLNSTRKFSPIHNKFLLELLNVKELDKKQLMYRSNELNIDLYKNYIISVSKNLPISEYEDLDKIYTFIENNINIKYKVLSAFDFNGNYIVFNPIDKNLSLEQIFKCTKLKIIKIKKELENFFNIKNFSFGIGTYHKSIDGIKTSYCEALRAFDCYKKFFNYDFIINFKDLGIYSILNNPSISDDIQKFTNKYIKPIIDSDIENNSELLKTLKCFFDSNRSFRNCAKEMNLHHNTIRYRLKKIEELCHIDITFENDLLELELALKLIPFLNKLGL